MSKISNVILMIEYLSSGRKYSIQELSDLIEVSPRMIRVYKEELEKAGIFVDTIKGPYGGYVLSKDANIPYLYFNNEDLKVLDECYLKISNIQVREKLNNLRNKVKIDLLKGENKQNSLMSYDSDDIELNVYNKLSRAIKNCYKVKINYYNLQHGNSIRTIYPLGMYLFQGEWWCSSYWEEKDDMRQFHIKRIIECEVLSERFNPNDINIKF